MNDLGKWAGDTIRAVSTLALPVGVCAGVLANPQNPLGGALVGGAMAAASVGVASLCLQSAGGPGIQPEAFFEWPVAFGMTTAQFEAQLLEVARKAITDLLAAELQLPMSQP
jgi:hypothetical protein